MNRDDLLRTVLGIKDELADVQLDLADEMAVTTSDSDHWPWLVASEGAIDEAAENLEFLAKGLR